jgi:hypothetical protein
MPGGEMIVKLEMISGRGYKLNVGPDHDHVWPLHPDAVDMKTF